MARLLSDSAAHKVWQEYHLVRECLRAADGRLGRSVDMAVLCAQLRAPRADVAVAAESAQAVPSYPTIAAAANDSVFKFKWLGIAASVVAVAAVGWQFLPANDQAHAAQIQAAETPPQAVAIEVVKPVGFSNSVGTATGATANAAYPQDGQKMAPKVQPVVLQEPQAQKP